MVVVPAKCPESVQMATGATTLRIEEIAQIAETMEEEIPAKALINFDK